MSLKKLEKEDFNSIKRYFIGSFEDASPPGELASPPGEDARGVTEPKQYQMQKTRYKAFELCSALYEKAWPFVIKRQILKCNRPRLIFMFY